MGPTQIPVKLATGFGSLVFFDVLDIEWRWIGSLHG